MKDMKVSYVDRGNTLVISTNKKGLMEMESNFSQLSSSESEIKLHQADYLDPEFISNLRFSSKKNNIEIITSSGKGWDFEVNPEAWAEFKEKISQLHKGSDRQLILHTDENAIPRYQMMLELEEESALVE